ANRHRQASFLRKLQELAGKHQAPLGMLPTEEGLEARAARAGEIDDRLIEHGELGPLKGSTEVCLEVAAADELHPRPGLETLVASAASLLRAVERDVCLLE